MWAALMSGQSWQGQFVNRRKDGTLYHDEATLSPVLDDRGRRIGIVGLHEDVTARIRAEAELQRRERCLNELLEQQTAIFDNAPPIALVCDGTLRQFNPAFVELMRAPAAELVGIDAGTVLGDRFVPCACRAGTGLWTAGARRCQLAPHGRQPFRGPHGRAQPACRRLPHGLHLGD